MPFNIGEFRSQINKHGIARDNLFVVKITTPFAHRDALPAQELQFFCRSVNVPQLNINTADVTNRGYGQNEKRPVSMPYENIQTVFMMDSNFLVKKFFQLWIQRVYNFDNSQGYNKELKETRALPFETGYRDQYSGTVEIIVYSTNTEDVTYHYTFQGAFPVNLGTMTLAWENNDNLLTLPVEFAYDTFKIDGAYKLTLSDSRYSSRFGFDFLSSIGGYGTALRTGPISAIQRAINDFTNIIPSNIIS